MIEFRMPQFGMGMTDGTILSWHKKEGDTITAGEPLLEVEAAKTTVDVEAPASGVLLKIIIAAGENVPVNTVIAQIGSEAGPAAEKTALREEADIPPSAPVPPTAVDGSTKASPLARRAAAEAGIDLAGVEGSGARGKVRAADVAIAAAGRSGATIQIEPRARRAAKELGIDLAEVAGTGPNGRVVEEDVRAFTAAPPAPPAAEPPPAPVAAPRAGGARVVPHSGMRRTIAARLTESKQNVPHFYLRTSCAIDALLALRRQLNEGSEGNKISVNDFIVRAAGLALRAKPEANVSWTEKAMLYHDTVDVAVAVATPRGLVTPIVRRVDEKPIRAIAAEIRDLAARGRTGKLKPEEYQGGSTSVSNLGMYGVEEFAAIINPPQASIFAIGAAEERAVIRDKAVVAVTMMNVTLSVDHRAVDGALGAELLAVFKKLIERPALILA